MAGLDDDSLARPCLLSPVTHFEVVAIRQVFPYGTLLVLIEETLTMDDKVAELPIFEHYSTLNAALLKSAARSLVHLHLFEFFDTIIIMLGIFNEGPQLLLDTRLLTPPLKSLMQLRD